MPIILAEPIKVVINDIGDKFVVESTKFNFVENTAEFFWRIKTENGKVLKQGLEKLSDKEFTKFYNEEYKTHEALVEKVAQLAGYSGEFNQETLK